MSKDKPDSTVPLRLSRDRRKLARKVVAELRFSAMSAGDEDELREIEAIYRAVNAKRHDRELTLQQMDILSMALASADEKKARRAARKVYRQSAKHR